MEPLLGHTIFGLAYIVVTVFILYKLRPKIPNTNPSNEREEEESRLILKGEEDSIYKSSY